MPSEAAKQEPPAKTTWLAALRVYLDRRQAVIFVMGFASGLPLLLTLSTLSYWLAKVGIDKTAIGLFALVGLPYTFKFIWAPFFDHVRPPLLWRWLGRRRGWILWIQAALVLAILALGTTDPAVDPWLTALAAFAVAFFSASQDIVVDAYRIEILGENEQGAGAASTQLGYRIGLLLAGAGAIALSDFFSWFLVFAVLAAALSFGMLAVLLAPTPRVRASQSERQDWGSRLRLAAVDPFLDFMRRPGWILILLFALLYKFGDAIGGVMANPFYIEIGFTGVEIASVTKVFGVLATALGVVVGGLMVARWGLFAALMVGGLLQAFTNLLFALQAAVGNEIAMLFVAIGMDNFTGGLGSAAFVAYLSSLCSARFTGTQYALLTSIMAFGRTVLSSGGGYLADQMDWITFFVATTVLAVPGLLLLVLLGTRYDWSEQRGKREEAAP